MDLQRLSIGQMAELNQVSTQTLRLYDRQGLLVPALVDAENAYRYYHVGQSARLDMIQHMKAYGMTLRQIKGQLNEEDPRAICDFLRAQMEDLEAQELRIRRRKRALRRVLENEERRDTLPPNGELFFEYIPERRIYTHRCSRNFFDLDYAGYEYILREMKQHMLCCGFDLSDFCNVGTIMRKEQLLSAELYTCDYFVFLDRESDCPGGEVLPSSTYCCVCSGDFYEEADLAKRLLAEIQDRAYGVCGDYVCEVIQDFPVFGDRGDGIFYKVQIPVRAGKS